MPFGSSPILNASVKTSLSKSKPFTAFFFVALAIQGFSFAHFFRQTGVRWFCPLWGSYSIERVAFLEPHDFVPEVCMEYPQYTYYIYIVYIHLHLHLHIHIHSNTYIYYIHILIDCEPFLPSRFKWTSETPAKPQRQQWIDVLFVWNSFLDGQSLNRVAVNTQIQWWYPLVN